MASLVLGVAGAAALGPAGLAWGGALGMSGAQIGFIAGSTLGSMLFAPNMPDVQGPRMADLKVQASTYGAPIPIYYGTARGAGQVIWSSDLIETSHEEEAGGKGGPSQSVTTYTYSVNCAIGICEGEITGIRKMWANGDLIYDASDTNLGPTGQSTNIRIYTGSETQMPDALLEAYLGAGNVPAHRGMAYVVFENLQLDKYGNRIPNFSFEVVGNGSFAYPQYQMLSAQGVIDIMPHPIIDDIFLVTTANVGGNNIILTVIDAVGKTTRTFTFDADPSSPVNGGHMTYVDYGTDPVTGLPVLLNELWICSYRDRSEYAIALDINTFELKRRIVPTNGSGIAYAGKIAFDKSNNKVLFGSVVSSISSGCNYLDPYTLLWETKQSIGGLTSVFTSNGVDGENSVCLGNYYNQAVFFNAGLVKVADTGISFSGGLQMAYDSRRNRYACYSRNVSGFTVYRVFEDDGAVFSYTDITTTSTIGNPSSFNYWKNADKYLWRAGDDFKILNAETFEIEQSFNQDINGDANAGNFEIPSLPEYFLGWANVSPSQGIVLVPLTQRISSNNALLSSIVTDICRRVDLGASDINVTALTDQVAGYTIAQQMSARAAIDGLQAAFFFDAVESD